MNGDFDTTTFFAAAEIEPRWSTHGRTWIKATPSTNVVLDQIDSPCMSPSALPLGSTRTISLKSSSKGLNRTNLKQLRSNKRVPKREVGVTCVSMFLGTLIICAALILLNQAWTSSTPIEYFQAITKTSFLRF